MRKDHSTLFLCFSQHSLPSAAGHHWGRALGKGGLWWNLLWLSHSIQSANLTPKAQGLRCVDWIASWFSIRNSQVTSRSCQWKASTVSGDVSAASSAHPDRRLVTVDPSDGKPGGQLQHILQHLFIQLQVGQLPLPFQRAQVDFVWREILGKPTKEERGNSKNNPQQSCWD